MYEDDIQKKTNIKKIFYLYFYRFVKRNSK